MHFFCSTKFLMTSPKPVGPKDPLFVAGVAGGGLLVTDTSPIFAIPRASRPPPRIDGFDDDTDGKLGGLPVLPAGPRPNFELPRPRSDPMNPVAPFNFDPK